MLVRLTPEGRATVDDAFEALLEAETELLAGLPEKEQAGCAGLLRTLLAPFALSRRVTRPDYSSSSAASSHSCSSPSFSAASAASSALSSASRS